MAEATIEPRTFVFFAVSFVLAAVLSLVAAFYPAPAAAASAAKKAEKDKKPADKKAASPASQGGGAAKLAASNSQWRLKTGAVAIVMWAIAGYFFVEIRQGKADLGFDPYAILEVQRDTPLGEISKAYRQLSRTHHPDRLLGLSHKEREESETKFKLISKAYEALTKEDAKKNFELYGHPDGPRAWSISFNIPESWTKKENEVVVLMVYVVVVGAVFGGFWQFAKTNA